MRWNWIAAFVLSAAGILCSAAEPRDDRNIDRVQKEADRGTGRIVDDQTHELDRIEQRDRRDIKEILDEQDRRAQIEKQEGKRTAAGVPTQPVERRERPLGGGEPTASDESGAGKLSLAAELLAAVDEHEQALKQARQQLKDAALRKRELQLEDELTRRLLGILDRYDVRRIQAPSTQPIIPTTQHLR